MFLQIVLLVLAVATLGFSWGARRMGSAKFALMSRWCRWFFVAGVGGYLLSKTGWTGYPLWVTTLVCFLAWFLMETVYNWFVISAISRSDLPFFPKFEESGQSSQWPKDRRSIQLRDWLRDHDFSKQQSLIARMEDQILMHVFVYEQKESHIRAHIIFLAGGSLINAVCCAFHAIDERGERWVTDNLFLPYGGFYPDTWHVERNPLMQSVHQLYHRHLERMDAALSEKWLPFEQDALTVLNNDRVLLEQLNRDMGFFSQEEDIDQIGRITPAGRYRIWQELWTISYLGRSRRYA